MQRAPASPTGSRAAAPPTAVATTVPEASARSVVQAWPQILERMAAAGPAQGFALFVRNPKVRPVALDAGVLLIECPTPMFQEQIRRHHAGLLAITAAEVLATPVQEVACKVSGPASREHERRAGAVASAIAQERAGEHDDEAAPESGAAPRRRAPGWGHGFKLLDSFVVGSCNRLAYDAVQQIISHPRTAVNPLFIHGASGLGKTHLEQGLALAFTQRYPNAKVQYVRCEQFTNEYVAACAKGMEALHAFRVRMRHPDLLLIDDIHFLSKGLMVKTKEELFATFDELAGQGKRVVITSDARPRDIQYLEERLIQRFSGGLVVELLKPDPALRREVIHAKARDLGLPLPDDVVDFVADHITDNIRELEGAVNKLVQYGRSFARRIDLAAARLALADLLARDAGEPMERLVLREVAAHFQLKVDDLTGRSRAGSRSEARHVAIYVLKSAGTATYAEIGRMVGVKSHGSVAHACEQVAKRRAAHPDLDRFIADLTQRITRS